MTTAPPRPSTKCVQRHCGRQYAEHVGERCPGGTNSFRRGCDRDRRASTSLSPAEVHALDEVLRMVRRGGDARLLARQLAQPLGLIASKVATMKARVASRAQESARSGADSRSSELERADVVPEVAS